MKYSLVVEAYERMEATTKRLEITDYLVELYKQTPKEDINKVVYLTQGKLYPDYMGVELGIAEKLAIRAVTSAAGASEEAVLSDLQRLGDLGETASHFLSKKAQIILLSGEPLTILRVYETLDKMARSVGEGSQEHKIKLLTSLLVDASPVEAKYIVRTVTGKLRLGIADMTMLDALALAYCGSKEYRPEIERAYNLSSDLGAVAKTVAERGVEGLKGFRITVGKPIRPMLAERLASVEEILKKFEGAGAFEYKYDGERLQAHKSGDRVELFSRRLENITSHYPDAQKLLAEGLEAGEAVVECECVAVNLGTGELMPFQELMHRRRKYQIQEAMKAYPVSLYLFDALYIDGEDLTLKPYTERRKALERIVKTTDRVKVARQTVTDEPAAVETFFEEAVAEGCEGLMAKATSPASVYQAGARGWLWIKYKRDYKANLTDTLDLVVVGGFYGRGRRGGFYGALLLAAYDETSDTFKTVCKLGAGLTDEDLAKLPGILNPFKIPKRHGRVDSKVEADAWFTPSLVMETLGSEITLSPTHTCGLNTIREGSGLAVRFPRFTGKYRTDKAPEDATTVKEIVEIYNAQLKKIT